MEKTRSFPRTKTRTLALNLLRIVNCIFSSTKISVFDAWAIIIICISHTCCVIVSGFTAALDLDTYPLRNFVHGALNGLNLVEVSQCSLCILAF